MYRSHYDDPEDIERLADAENQKYDAERLIRLKPIDVYDYIENCLGLRVDFQYITPNRSCLGVTFFSYASIWVWGGFYDGKKYASPTEEELIRHFNLHRITVSPNTIMIDQSLLDNYEYARENFTALHECGHYHYDKSDCEARESIFSDAPEPYIYGGNRRMNKNQKSEWRANTFASAMLMPKSPTIVAFLALMELSSAPKEPLPFNQKILRVISEMAQMCGASPEAMEYRLGGLKLIQKRKKQ